jgi:hypothetical protein
MDNDSIESAVAEVLGAKLPFKLLSSSSAMELANILLFQPGNPYAVIPRITSQLAAPEIASIFVALTAVLYLTDKRNRLSSQEKSSFEQKITSLVSTFGQTPKVDEYMSHISDLSETQIRALLDPYFPVFQRDRSAWREYQKRHPDIFSPAVDYRLAEMALNSYIDQNGEMERLLTEIRTDLFFTGYHHNK